METVLENRHNKWGGTPKTSNPENIRNENTKKNNSDHMSGESTSAK